MSLPWHEPLLVSDSLGAGLPVWAFDDKPLSTGPSAPINLGNDIFCCRPLVGLPPDGNLLLARVCPLGLVGRRPPRADLLVMASWHQPK